MYAGNSFSRRRSEGWVERRRYFRKLLEKVRPADEKAKEKSAGSAK